MHYLLKILTVILFALCGCRRSVHRPESSHLPKITTQWADDPSRQNTLKNSHLEPHIFTIYDEHYFKDHALPPTIPWRHDPEKYFQTDHLVKDLEAAVLQLCSTHKKIKKMDRFIILKQRDYNYLKHTGLIILRHKEYPFVIKLFMETPENFVRPFNRGIEECAFFIMGGGMSRYLAGFTRIPNRHEIAKKIAGNRYWEKLIDTPRKWFWQPPQSRWIEITGTHIGLEGDQYMCLPSMYAIICDAIQTDYGFSVLRRNDREIAISITQFLGMRIDPHINNFIVEKESKKIIIIDTEHFPTLIGIKDTFKINDFFTYYMRLALKFFNNKLTFDKKMRKDLQENPRKPIFPYSL